MPPSESPIACVLEALDSDQRQRHQRLVGELRKAVIGAKELSDGFALQLRDDEATWMNTSEFITLERRICPILGYSLDA